MCSIFFFSEAQAILCPFHVRQYVISGVSGPGNAVMLMIEQHLGLMPNGFALFSMPSHRTN